MHKNQPHTHTTVISPLGRMLLAATPHGLRGVWFEGQAHSPTWPDEAHSTAANGTTSDWPMPSVLARTAAWLSLYFEGQPTGDLPPLDPTVGTEFQRAVWQQLQRIPPGATRTYSDLAKALGKPQAHRAVGAAVGRNPWSVLVPCHRVIGSTGALTGYAGGLERKRALLTLEGALPLCTAHASAHAALPTARHPHAPTRS